ERLIRAEEELVAILRPEAGRVGNAAGHGRVKRTPSRDEVFLLEGPADALRDRHRRSCRRLREQDGELLAAVARGDVARADGRPEDLAEAADRDVAGRVSVRVVDALEVVEVEERDGQRRPVAQRA